MFTFPTRICYRGHNSQLDTLIQFAYIFVDVQNICSWSIPVNRMGIKPTVFRRECLNLYTGDFENEVCADMMPMH